MIIAGKVSIHKKNNIWLLRLLLIVPVFLISFLTWKEYILFGLGITAVSVLAKLKKESNIVIWLIFTYIIYLSFNNTWIHIFTVSLIALLCLLNIRKFRVSDVFFSSISGALSILLFYIICIKLFAGADFEKFVKIVVFIIEAGILYIVNKELRVNEIKGTVIVAFTVFLVVGATRVSLSMYYSKVAESELSRGNTPKAAGYFKKAVSLNRLYYSSYIKLVKLYSEQGDFDKVIEVLTEFFVWHPYEATEMKRLFGKAAVLTGKLEKIVEFDIGPVNDLNFKDNYRLAQYFRANYYYEDALEQINKVTPETLLQIKESGMFFYDMGLYERAERLLQQVEFQDVEISMAMNGIGQKISRLNNFYEFYEKKKTNEIEKIAEKEDWKPKSYNWPGGENAWYMGWSGTSYIKINIEKEYEVIYIEVYGKKAVHIWPIMEVGLDDKSIDKKYVNSDKLQYFKLTINSQPGEHKLWIKFTNDYWDRKTKQNRDLYLGSVYRIKK